MTARTDVDSAMPPLPRRPAIRVAKLGGALIAYAIGGAARTLQRLVGSHPSPTEIVIFYHQVPADHRERFARQMDHLRRWAVPGRIDHKPTTSRPGIRSAIVTADDGWQSFYENAIPELAKRGIPSIIFVISNRLGETLGEVADRIITESELKSLDPQLVTVGSHTATHARVPAKTQLEASRELTQSRAELERILGREVRLFCFPFGAYDEQAIQLCRNAGYQRVFISIPAGPGHDGDDYVVGRVRVDPTDWPIEFHLKLMGAYQWLGYAVALKRAVKRLASRSLGRTPRAPQPAMVKRG